MWQWKKHVLGGIGYRSLRIPTYTPGTKPKSWPKERSGRLIQGNRSTSNYTPQLCLYPPSRAQPSQNFIPSVPILLVVHLVKDLSYTPRNLSLVKNLIPPGGIIRGTSLYTLLHFLSTTTDCRPACRHAKKRLLYHLVDMRQSKLGVGLGFADI